MGTLPEKILHPEASLLQTNIEEGILVHTGPPWLRQDLNHTISNGHHALECTPEMAGFICWEMQRRVQDGFIILLPASYTVQIFGYDLKIVPHRGGTPGTSPIAPHPKPVGKTQ